MKKAINDSAILVGAIVISLMCEIVVENGEIYENKGNNGDRWRRLKSYGKPVL